LNDATKTSILEVIMIRCSNCGAETVSAARFCAECGADIAGAPRTEPADRFSGDSADVGVRSGEDAPAAPTPADRTVQAAQRKIENHLVKSIAATLCCCLPFGILGIIYAARVDTLLRQGNFAAAEDASKKADLWSNLAIGIGLVMNLLGVLTAVVLPMLLGTGDIFSNFER
jgi:hypothetical protein